MKGRYSLMTKQLKKHLVLILAFALAFSSVVPATLYAKENTEITSEYLNNVNNTYVGVKFFDGNSKHLINSKLLEKNNKFDVEFIKDYPLKSTKLDGDKVNITLKETNPERLVNFIMLVEKHNAELSELEALKKLNEIIRNEEFYEEDTVKIQEDNKENTEETKPIAEEDKKSTDDKKEPAEEPKEEEKPVEDKKDDDKSESKSIYDKIKRKLQEQSKYALS